MPRLTWLLLFACNGEPARAREHFAKAHHCKATMIAVAARGDALFEVTGCEHTDLLRCRRGSCVVELPEVPQSAPATTLPVAQDTELLQRTVQTRKPQIRVCYDRALATNAGLAGRIYVQFSISVDGRVSNASVSRSTLHDQTLEACVAKELLQLRFPERAEPMNVSYPIELKP